MRLWSIHPKYLDPKGLVALWREALLAKEVIYGKTKGYRNHPQLIRFYNTKNPRASINVYLIYIYEEAKNRGYNFNVNKIDKIEKNMEEKIPVTSGQVEYEMELLKIKLVERNREWLKKLNNVKKIETNPIFIVIPGGIEKWEKVKNEIKKKNSL